MAVFAWDPKLYDVGVAAMNNQHQGLIKLMNLIHDRNAANAPKDELAKLLGQLGELTTRHFKEEEAYMDSVQFADAKTHKMIHAKLLADFGTHVQKFSAGNGHIGPEFFSFLSLWLRSHIQHLDTRYCLKLRAAG